jgi:hypothetical protein
VQEQPDGRGDGNHYQGPDDTQQDPADQHRDQAAAPGQRFIRGGASVGMDTSLVPVHLPGMARTNGTGLFSWV